MSQRLSAALTLLALCATLMARTYTLASPDGRLTARIDVGTALTYSLWAGCRPLIQPSALALSTDRGLWGSGSHLRRATTTSHNGQIAAWGYKRATVTDCYRGLRLSFREGFSVEWRLYDEGLAYRFVSDQDRELTIRDEVAELRFARDWPVYAAYVKDRGTREEQLHNSFENSYAHTRLTGLDASRLIFSPLVVEADDGLRLCVAESDVENYPGQFWVADGHGPRLTAVSARYPRRTVVGGHRNLEQVVVGREDYLVRARARQRMPWRIVGVAHGDAQLLDNDMVYRLASPSRVADTAWIRPGLAAWDWWCDRRLVGVPFRSGINTQTYKHFIDFAQRYGIPYLLVDGGWSPQAENNLMSVVPEVDLPELVRYGRERGVGLLLLAGQYSFDRDMERVCSHYAAMGIKGFKIDFINRDDAMAVNFHYRAAATAARYHLLIDFHGTYKPTGLNRTYPNVVNFEGVNGQEQVKWNAIRDYDQVTYDVTMPLIRMVAGPVDYTPGAMVNGTRRTYSPGHPMSQGTRAHQLAQYVVFLAPLNMLCDSPSRYDREPECTRFIASVPTVWDETIPLQCQLGQYVAVARRRAGRWYVAALGGWTPRALRLDLTPLHVAGRRAEVWSDGVNADVSADDYRHHTTTVPGDAQVDVHLAPGGGFVMVIG